MFRGLQWSDILHIQRSSLIRYSLCSGVFDDQIFSMFRSVHWSDILHVQECSLIRYSPCSGMLLIRYSPCSGVFTDQIFYMFRDAPDQIIFMYRDVPNQIFSMYRDVPNQIFSMYRDVPNQIFSMSCSRVCLHCKFTRYCLCVLWILHAGTPLVHRIYLKLIACDAIYFNPEIPKASCICFQSLYHI